MAKYMPWATNGLLAGTTSSSISSSGIRILPWTSVTIDMGTGISKPVSSVTPNISLAWMDVIWPSIGSSTKRTKSPILNFISIDQLKLRIYLYPCGHCTNVVQYADPSHVENTVYPPATAVDTSLDQPVH